jgi:hypothetical protein
MSRKPKQSDPDLAKWCVALASPLVPDPVPPGWHTIKQLSKQLGTPRSSLSRQLNDAVAAGRCEVASFRVVVGSFVRATPHYRLH